MRKGLDCKITNVLYEKNTDQNQIKFNTDDYLQIHKILQLFTTHLQKLQTYWLVKSY